MKIFWFCWINFRTLGEKILGFSQKISKRVVKTTLYVSGEIFWEIHLQELTNRSYPDCREETICRVVIIVFCNSLDTTEETFSLQKMIFFRHFGQKFHETLIHDISSRLMKPYSTCLKELLERVVPQKLREEIKMFGLWPDNYRTSIQKLSTEMSEMLSTSPKKDFGKKCKKKNVWLYVFSGPCGNNCEFYTKIFRPEC